MENEEKNIFSKILKKRTLKILLIPLLLFLFVGIFCFIYLAEAKTDNVRKVTLLIYPKDDFTAVKSDLIREGVVGSSNIPFSLFSKVLRYSENVKAGHYVIEPKTSVLSLVRKLRAGNQDPVKMVILTSRTAEDFSKKVCNHLMIDHDELMKEIKTRTVNHTNEIFEYIVPNTYDVYWTTTARDFLDKLKKESDRFWQKNEEKLKSSALTKREVIILASIVGEETNKRDEMPRIAGVYINRLKKNMLLQSDPTVKFAVGDFSLRRITGKHLQTESEFNTYKHSGLPPAPICMPSTEALSAVLNYERHDYVYFCAKEDFSGYHNFASTHAEHIQNAIRYRNALNQRGIK